MDRLSSDITRNQNLNRQGIHPQPEQKKEQSSGPVLRQRGKGRDDDESENGEYKSQNALTLSEHSEPLEKTRKNRMPLQLEMRDQEKFVFSVQQFYDALEKNDAKELVRMLRHGTQVQSNQSIYTEAVIITKKLFDSNKPELLAELIRESGAFASGFHATLSGFDSASDLNRLADFIKVMNDSRDLPKDCKEMILSQLYHKSIKFDLPEVVEVVIQLESSILHNKIYGGYIEQIQYAALEKRSKILAMLIENIFAEKFNVKSGVSNLICTQAAGFAFSIDRSDLTIRLQDSVISREKISDENYVDDEVRSSKKLIRKSLGSMMSDPNEFKFMEIVVSKLIEVSQNHIEKGGKNYNPVLIQYGNQSRSIDFLFLREIEQSFVAECIRPDLAEVMAQTGKQAYNQVSEWFNEATGKISDEDYDEDKFISLLASQWGSLVLDDENIDELTAAQVLMLKNLSNNYIKTRLGSIPDLIDQCFDFIDPGITIDANDVSEHLMDEFIFPEPLAIFLAEAMVDVVTDLASRPSPALPSNLKIKDVGEYLKNMLKENASREFKNNFSEIIKQQKLITLFNQDAKGREELWSSYFYAYLDVLKAALPSPKTEHCN